MLELIIDNKSSADFGLCLAETPSIPSPERDVERVPVRGRHGSLTKKYAYKDISFSVSLNLLEDDGIKDKLRYIRAWILNAKKLQLSDDSVFYRIKESNIPDIDNELNLLGKFEANFVADPFQFKESKIVSLNSPGKVLYSGTIESEPYIKIYGTGNGSLTFNSDVIHFQEISEYIEIDCENQQAFKGTDPRNDKMIGEYPVLQIGENDISWNGGITKIEIDVREVYL